MIRDFEYFGPKTLQEALTLLDKYRDNCKIIAGGQSLLKLMREGLVIPQVLVGIKGISELNYIKSEGNKGLRIGALTTHRTIEESPMMQNGLRILGEMERRLAFIQIRNWGTIGGNLCHADPAQDPAPVLMALNANLRTASLRGERNMAIEDFFRDHLRTALEPGELLAEIQIPAVPPHTGAVYTKFNIIENDLATVGVAVFMTLGSSSDVCQDVRIALGASAPTPMRAKRAEGVLRGKKITDDLLSEAGQMASAEAEPLSDINASGEYRRQLVKVLVKRMGNEAMTRARQA